MYNVRSRQLVLEIPKNGSRSLVQAAVLGYGKQWLKLQGHHTLKELLPRLYKEVKSPPAVPVVVAVIRNPVDRLVSQVAHVLKHKQGAGLDYAMNVCWEQSDIVFKPQSEFVALPDVGDCDLRLFDMRYMDHALSFVAGRPVDVHANQNWIASRMKFTDSIMRHRLFDAIMAERYGRDTKLWVEAGKRDINGRR